MFGLAENLKHCVNHDFLDGVEAMLTEFGASPEVRATVVEYARLKQASINELADALGAPEDVSELYRSTSYLWLELKTEWVRYNQTMQYQVARDGEADPVVFTKGAVCSSVIGCIEGLLSPEDLEKLGVISEEPLAVGKLDTRDLQKFLAHHEQQIGAIARIYASASTILGTVPDLAKSRDSAPPALQDHPTRYQQMLEGLARETELVLKVDVGLIWPVLAEYGEEARRDLGKPAQLVNDCVQGAKVDLRLAHAVTQLTRSVAHFLLLHGQESDEARVRADKPTHGTVKVRVETGDRATVLVLSDDGHGAPTAALAQSAAAQEDWHALQAQVAALDGSVSISGELGVGTTVSLSLSCVGLTGGETFVVVEGSSPRVCVPIELVSPDTSASGAMSGDEQMLDVRTNHEALPSYCRLTFPSGRRVVIVGSGIASRAQGIAIPATSVEDALPEAFRFGVLTPTGLAGMLDERAFRSLTGSEASAAREVA